MVTGTVLLAGQLSTPCSLHHHPLDIPPVPPTMALGTLRVLKLLPHWLLAYILLSLVVNVLPITQYVPPISPTTLIYAPQDAFLPLLLSLFLIPSYIALFSRIVHVLWLCSYLSSASAIAPCASLYPRQLLTAHTVLLFNRSLLGFLLTRSVGWTYPALLSPHALYEPVYGIGPLIVDAVVFAAVSDGFIMSYGISKTGARRPTLTRLTSLAVFAMTDRMPWSYACAVASAGIRRLFEAVVSYFYPSNPDHGYTDILWRGRGSTLSLPPSHPRPSSSARQSRTSLSKRQIMVQTLAATAISWLFGSVPHYVRPLGMRLRRGADAAVFPPDLHIVMLTYPREKDLASDYMIDSIQCYLDSWRACRASRTQH